MLDGNLDFRDDDKECNKFPRDLVYYMIDLCPSFRETAEKFLKFDYKKKLEYYSSFFDVAGEEPSDVVKLGNDLCVRIDSNTGQGIRFSRNVQCYLVKPVFNFIIRGVKGANDRDVQKGVDDDFYFNFLVRNKTTGVLLKFQANIADALINEGLTDDGSSLLKFEIPFAPCSEDFGEINKNDQLEFAMIACNDNVLLDSSNYLKYQKPFLKYIRDTQSHFYIDSIKVQISGSSFYRSQEIRLNNKHSSFRSLIYKFIRDLVEEEKQMNESLEKLKKELNRKDEHIKNLSEKLEKRNSQIQEAIDLIDM